MLRNPCTNARSAGQVQLSISPRVKKFCGTDRSSTYFTLSGLGRYAWENAMMLIHHMTKQLHRAESKPAIAQFCKQPSILQLSILVNCTRCCKYSNSSGDGMTLQCHSDKSDNRCGCSHASLKGIAHHRQLKWQHFIIDQPMGDHECRLRNDLIREPQLMLGLLQV